MDFRAEAILEWLNGFESIQNLTDISGLYDSVVLGKALTEIDPFFADLQFTIPTVEGEIISWTEKASNLDKIKLALETYYTNLLLKGFKVNDDIDTCAIANGRGLDDFFNLMELICGAAAMCTNHAHFDQIVLKLSPASQSYLKDLRENSFINTYDLDNGKDDISDLSNDSDSSDNDSGNDLLLPSSHIIDRATAQGDSLFLKHHLETKAALQIQKKITREDEAEKAHLKQIINSLTAANKSLQKAVSTKGTHEIRTEEELLVAQTAITTLQLEVASLTTRVQSAESLCSDLKQHIQSTQEEVNAAREANHELIKAKEIVEIYKQKVDCLSPVLAINEHLEASLEESQAQLEAVERAVSTRIQLEEQMKATDLEDLQIEHERVKTYYLSQKEELIALIECNHQLKEELDAKTLLLADHEKLQDELSLQCLHSLELEQKVDTHQVVFRQYKTLLKDTYKIIQELQSEPKHHSSPSSMKKKKKVSTPIALPSPAATSAPSPFETLTNTEDRHLL
jgi:hypothetical protein